jgi:type II secretory pathway component PulF
MTSEQLAFVNQQLAGMLQAGLPLEGALHRLCQDLGGGVLKRELEALHADLARGTPLAQALGSRRFPELYRRVLMVGVRGDDLPGALILLADYYQRAHLLWTRLKGLMVYPVMVLAGCAALAAFVAWIFTTVGSGNGGVMQVLWGDAAAQDRIRGDLLRLWAPVLGFGGLAVLWALGLLIPGVRRALRWRMPGFRESALANLASTMHLLLARGCALGDAVELVRQMEGDSPAGRELAEWSRRIAAGEGRPSQFAAQGRVLPPLFRWMICQGGEDLAEGFRRAAELYHARAMHRSDLLLHLALPLSILILGMMILAQFYPLMRVLILQLDQLGAIDG